eukprot:3166613-Amphidinium_carterae.1
MGELPRCRGGQFLDTEVRLLDGIGSIPLGGRRAGRGACPGDFRPWEHVGVHREAIGGGLRLRGRRHIVAHC